MWNSQYSLSWAEPTHIFLLTPISSSCILILPSHLRLSWIILQWILKSDDKVNCMRCFKYTDYWLKNLSVWRNKTIKHKLRKSELILEVRIPKMESHNSSISSETAIISSTSWHSRRNITIAGIYIDFKIFTATSTFF